MNPELSKFKIHTAYRTRMKLLTRKVVSRFPSTHAETHFKEKQSTIYLQCSIKLGSLVIMEKPSQCESLLQYFPSASEYHDFFSTVIANSVFNIFLCCTAIVSNIVAVHAIRKTSSLPNNLKALLVSLAVSDVGVGLLAHPLYSSFLVNWLQQNNPGCEIFKAFLVIMTFISAASFFGVMAISPERFLAFHLHLRYQELVTYKRVVGVVISVWVLSALVSPLILCLESDAHH